MSPDRNFYLLLGGWLILTGFSVSAETLFFRSNSLGMPLEPIKPQAQASYEYVVKVEKSAVQESRSLFSEGKEIKKWVYYYTGRQVLKEKWEFEDGLLQLKEIYSPAGELAEEILYTQGVFKERRKYSYDNEGALRILESYTEQHKLLYSERYLYHGNGMLREIFRLLPDGTYQVATYSVGGGRLFEERFGDNEIFYINRFDPAGHLVLSETWRREKLVYKVSREYRPTGKLATLTEEDLENGITLTKRYDEQGKLLGEGTNGQREQDTVYTYDSQGRVIKKYKKGKEGAEEWRYEYDDEDQVKKETYLHLGSVEKITVYTGQASWHEEIYRNGSLFLRVHYEKNEKIKDEFIKGGQVISERLYK